MIIFDVQFARLFAAPVEAAGLAVHVQRAGEDVALDPGFAAGFEQDDVAEDVDAGGFHGLLVGFPDVGEAAKSNTASAPLTTVLTRSSSSRLPVTIFWSGRR